MYKNPAKAKAFKLADEGATKEEIANYLGVSRRTVLRWLNARRELSRHRSCKSNRFHLRMHNDADMPELSFLFLGRFKSP